MTLFVVLGLLAGLGVGLIYFGFLGRPTGGDDDQTIVDAAVVDAAGVDERPRRSLREMLAGPLGELAGPFVPEQRRNQLQVELNRAGLSLRAPEFAMLQAGCAVLLALIVFLRFQNLIPAVLAAVAGYYLPTLYVRYRQRQRRHAFEASLGDTIGMLSNGVKAGLSMQQSMAGVAESGRPPLSEEIARVLRETALGIDLETALEHANLRLNSKDFDLLVTAMLIHRTVGGNLAEVLDKIAATIRERVRIHGEVRVLTAQARASGYIITALPFFVVLVLSFVSPSFERPLFTNPIGWGLITVALISISIGFAIIRRITDIHL